jgi:hypothetical protein
MSTPVEATTLSETSAELVSGLGLGLGLGSHFSSQLTAGARALGWWAHNLNEYKVKKV